MNSSSKRTLKLNRETVRALTGGEMTAVAGGAAQVMLPKPYPTLPSPSVRCQTGLACPTMLTFKCNTFRVCY